MALKPQQRGKLKCNNEKCGRLFEVADFRPNTGVRCHHCGKVSQYRTQDYVRENYNKEMLTGDESLEELDRKRAALKDDLKKLHGPAKREKETHLQDVELEIEKRKKKAIEDDVLY
jgi:hypothetical protein